MMDMPLSDNDFFVLEAPAYAVLGGNNWFHDEYQYKSEIDEEDVSDLRRAFSRDASIDIDEIASQLENKEIAGILRRCRYGTFCS